MRSREHTGLEGVTARPGGAPLGILWDLDPIAKWRLHIRYTRASPASAPAAAPIRYLCAHRRLLTA